MPTDATDIRSAALARIEPSATIAVTKKAQALRAAGRDDIIALSSGEPDFVTPDNVRAAAIAAIERGETKYPPVAGIAPLKTAIRDKFARDNGLDYGPDEVLVSTGGKQVIANALMATLNAGDEVVVPAPYWVSYPQLTRLCGAQPVIVDTRADDGFCLQAADLDAAITPRTRWVVLNNPCNPTGTVYSRAQLAALTEVLLDHPHVWLLSDDMYEHLLYDGRTFYTPGQVEPRLASRLLTVNGVSKAYAMTGWRIGYGGGPARLIKHMETLQSQLTHGASQIGQWAATEALSGPQDFVAMARSAFARRRDLVLQLMEAVPGLRPHRPGGAFYLFVSCADFIGRRSAAGQIVHSDDEFCAALLEEAGVGLVPGTAFGASPYFRLSYAADESTLQTASRRIAAFCAGFSN